MPPGKTLKRLDGFLRGHGPTYACGLALSAGLTWAVTGPLRSGANWMYLEQDDFFYYLKTAGNVAAGRGSTLNGAVATNGYHPLWMLALAAVLRMGAGPHGVLVFLAASIWLATMATFTLSAILLRRSGLPPLMSATASVFVAVYCMHIAAECMEVTLAIPFMLGLLTAAGAVEWWAAPGARGFRRGLALGLLTAAMVLSRLDTALFAALLTCAMASDAGLRRKAGVPLCTGFVVGALPVPAYLLTNRLVFGLWLPVSGSVKQLKIDHGFTARAWGSFLVLTPSQWIPMACILGRTVLLPRYWTRLRPIDRALAAASLAFPWIYFASLSWLSDWKLWDWYFYSLRPALCLAFLVLLRAPGIGRILQPRFARVLLLALALGRALHLRWDQQNPGIVDTAMQLRSFTRSHPGVYAMGDRSGAVSLLLPAPLVQTEGLVMDRNYLELIRRQVPLRTALARYGVRYYVGTTRSTDRGCFHAVEPSQAGPHAPHLQATFCGHPLARWTESGIQTMVFDLASKAGEGSTP